MSKLIVPIMKVGKTFELPSMFLYNELLNYHVSVSRGSQYEIYLSMMAFYLSYTCTTDFKSL